MYYKIARSLVVGLLAATFLAGVSTSTVAKADGFALKGDPKPVFVYFNVKNFNRKKFSTFTRSKTSSYVAV